MSIKSHIITGAVCFVLGSLVCAGVAWKASKQAESKFADTISELERNKQSIIGELGTIGNGIDKAVGNIENGTSGIAKSLDSIGTLRTITERNRALAEQIGRIAEILAEADQSLRSTKSAIDSIVNGTDGTGSMGMDRRQDIPVE